MLGFAVTKLMIRPHSGVYVADIARNGKALCVSYVVSGVDLQTAVLDTCNQVTGRSSCVCCAEEVSVDVV